ncbi:MAG: glycosyltransferase [Opitutaceae bacterium]
MKICLFTSDLAPGGAQRVFINLANHWHSQGHEIEFVVFTTQGSFRTEIAQGIKVVSLDRFFPKLPLRLDYILRFTRYLRKAQPDLVYSTLTQATISSLYARELSNFKGKLIVRQANSLVNQDSRPRGTRLWNWFGYQIAYRWADSIIVNSQNSRIEIEKKYPHLASKLRLIYNPVLLPRGLIRSRNSTKPAEILASGRFAEQKDYPTLLRAFKLVLEQVDAKLTILGDGKDRRAIEALIDQLGISSSVKLEGYVDDPYAYYSRANVFVLSSKWEGFPNVLAEALASDCPAVVTDGKGASREILEPILPDNIVEVGDVQSLALRIRETIENPLAEGIIREHTLSRFAITSIADQYLELKNP